MSPLQTKNVGNTSFGQKVGDIIGYFDNGLPPSWERFTLTMQIVYLTLGFLI